VIATGKWLAGVVTAMGAILISGGLLVLLFQTIPFQDLGLRFSIGTPQIAGALAALLPLCPLIVAAQMYLATFAKSFKEAQSYLSVAMMGVMLPGFIQTMYPIGNKTWMYFVPVLGQQAIIGDVMGGKPALPWFFAAGAAVNLLLAILAIKATTALLHREKIVFGR